MMKKTVALVLAAALLICLVPAYAIESVAAQPSDWSIFADGEAKSLAGYNIGGTNYYKLRDIAMALGKTEKKFEVKWERETNRIYISSNTAYTPVGGELTGGGLQAGKVSAVPTVSEVYFDGKLMDFTSYFINGNNYFKLREILKSIDCGLTWNAQDKTVMISSKLPYSEEGDSTGSPENSVVIVRKLDKNRNLISESLGFLISDDGKIATVFSAINGADIVVVSFPGETEQDIQGVIAYNRAKNIAVVKSSLNAGSYIELSAEKSEPAEFTAYSNNGKNLLEKISGKRTGEAVGCRGEGVRDIMVNFKLAPNSIGGPVINAEGRAVGMVYSGVVHGQRQMLAIPAADIAALNTDAEPKNMEEFRRAVFPMRGNATEKMLSDMLYNEVSPLRLGDERIKVFGVIAKVVDPVTRRMHIQIYVPENDGNGYLFRQHSMTTAGAEKLFSYCKKMMEVIDTYFPEYEVEGEIHCVTTRVTEWDENGKIKDFLVYDNEYHYGRKLTFAYGSEYNGWEFEIE